MEGYKRSILYSNARAPVAQLVRAFGSSSSAAHIVSWKDEPCLVVSAPSAEVLNVRKAKEIPLLVQNEEQMHKCVLLIGDPSFTLST